MKEKRSLIKKKAPTSEKMEGEVLRKLAIGYPGVLSLWI